MELQLFLAAVCFVILAARRKFRLGVLFVAAIFIGMGWCLASARFIHSTLDSELWRLDSFLGYDPHFVISLFYATPLVVGISGIVYLAYAVGLAVAALATGEPEEFFTKVAIATLLATLLCMAFPACGPWFSMQNLLSSAPRNAMPSMHTTWALLIFWNLRKQSLSVRVASDVWLLLTVIATLGTGQHYLVDIIAAVPFTALVEFCMSTPKLVPEMATNRLEPAFSLSLSSERT
jgi:hypothetical protein